MRSHPRAALVVLLLSLAGTVASTAPEGRRHLRLSGPTGDLPFSDGVLVGDTLYLSGKLGIDPRTGKIPDDVEREVRLALDGIRATLAEAGMTMDDLVQVQVFCSDLSLYEPFNRVYRTYFRGNYPARAFLGSAPLLRGARFEVMGVAVRPGAGTD